MGNICAYGLLRYGSSACRNDRDTWLSSIITKIFLGFCVCRHVSKKEELLTVVNSWVRNCWEILTLKSLWPDGMHLMVLREPADVIVRLLSIAETLKKSSDWRLLQVLHTFSELAAPIFKKSNSYAVSIVLALGKIMRWILLGTISTHMKEKKTLWNMKLVCFYISITVIFFLYSNYNFEFINYWMIFSVSYWCFLKPHLTASVTICPGMFVSLLFSLAPGNRDSMLIWMAFEFWSANLLFSWLQTSLYLMKYFFCCCCFYFLNIHSNFRYSVNSVLSQRKAWDKLSCAIIYSYWLLY